MNETQAEITQTELDDVSKEHWFKTYWLPTIGWLYASICACDFILFPLISIMLPIVTKTAYVPWTPLSLTNGGMVHFTFLGILGINTWNKGRLEIATASPTDTPLKV